MLVCFMPFDKYASQFWTTDYLQGCSTHLTVGRHFRESQFTHCHNTSPTLKYYVIILSERTASSACVYASGREADIILQYYKTIAHTEASGFTSLQGMVE